MPSAAVGVSVAFGILHGRYEDSCICTMAGMERYTHGIGSGSVCMALFLWSIKNINLSSSYTVC